jgi:hypothetical protein
VPSTNPPLPTAERAWSIALRGATEDYFGLHEVLWELNAEFPEALESTKLQVAIAAVERLLQDGLVDVYAATWARDAFAPVPRSQVVDLLRQARSWQPEEEYLCIAATDAGMTTYSHFGVNSGGSKT